MNEYEEFIERNNIDKNDMESIILKVILLNIFERICKYLQKENNMEILKSKLRKLDTPFEELLEYKKLVKKIVDIDLSDSEIKYMQKLVSAFLNKTKTRWTLSEDMRRNILKSQNFKCKYCGNDISVNNCIDHVIAFKYVGDELIDNYQGLCNRCNEHKRDNLYIFFDSILKMCR